jgi:hypothetical protein
MLTEFHVQSSGANGPHELADWREAEMVQERPMLVMSMFPHISLNRTFAMVPEKTSPEKVPDTVALTAEAPTGADTDGGPIANSTVSFMSGASTATSLLATRHRVGTSAWNRVIRAVVETSKLTG